MRTIIWFLYFGFVLLLTIPSWLAVKFHKKAGNEKRKAKIVDHTVKWWARSLVRLSGSNVEVIGEEHVPQDGSYLFVSNHQGNFDVPLLLGYIKKPKSFISKAEVKKMPIIGSWMDEMNCVFMDRSNVRQSLKAIQQGAKYLKEGTSIVIFPEGTRSKGDEIGEFKAGSFKLATKSGVPVIPVTIKGSYRIMESQKFWIRPANVQIIISPPIVSEGKDAKVLAEETFQAVSSHLSTENLQKRA